MKYVFYGLIIIVLGLVGFLFFGGTVGGKALPQDDSVSAVGVLDGDVLKFSTSITNRSYSPKQIEVPFGAVVEITVKNNDNEQHGLSLSDFGVNDFVAPLQTKTIRFTANKKGESVTFCSVNHPEKLIVNVI